MACGFPFRIKWCGATSDWLVGLSPCIPMDPQPFMVNLRGWFTVYQQRQRERHILLYHWCYYWCYYWIYSKQLWQAYCYVGICICTYIYIYINWHSKLIYIYIYIYLLLVYYQRSTVRFLRSAVPTPFPGRHGRQGTAEAETSLDFCLAKSSYWEQKNGGGSGFLPCFNGVPFLNQLRIQKTLRFMKING